MNTTLAVTEKRKYTKHGMTNTRQYGIFRAMHQRCNNKKTLKYKNYGGRGITVCKEWKDFTQFWSDMKDTYSDNLTLDRIDNDGNYCKENCRWITLGEQQLNKKDNRFITANDKTMTVTEWANYLDVKRTTLFSRLAEGWSDEDVINIKVRK